MQTYYTPESALYVILFFKKVVKWCYRIDWLLNEHDWYADSGMKYLIIELGAENKWTPNKIITGKVENDKKSD